MITDLESDLVERKEAFLGNVPVAARETICAFANDLPDHRCAGVLFIGVNDAGKPIGLPVTDQLLLTLADIKTDGNIVPPPSLTVQKRRLFGVDVAVVTVMPASAPPARYKGRIHIRTGPRERVRVEALRRHKTNAF